jgi:hypothetical protein
MHFQKLYTDIFNGSAVDTDNITMLRKVADEYPYFSLAHFFLLKKAIDTGQDPENIASKTALHFNNPFLLNEQLHRSPVYPKVFEEPVAEPEQEIIMESLPAGEQKITAPLTTVETVQEITVMPQEEEHKPMPEPLLVEEEIILESIEDMEEAETGEIAEPETMDVSASNNNPVRAQLVPSTGEEKQKEELPIFEPLFASDYFASQGIKFSEEQQPTDRMGKQLKSFTEWLKTMKKVHETKQPTAEAAVDITVQNLAEKSNKEAEIITEAMAEVFLQQGKTNKAKEIYEKLSLLNPSKNAYFAAKLEQIK